MGRYNGKTKEPEEDCGCGGTPAKKKENAAEVAKAAANKVSSSEYQAELARQASAKRSR